MIPWLLFSIFQLYTRDSTEAEWLRKQQLMKKYIVLFCRKKTDN
jgi:hypothetical protein